MASFRIKLERLRLFGHHGVFEEERILGAEFEVSLQLKVKAPKEIVTSLHETVNYAEVYKLVKERFDIPTPLLETLAQQIAAAVQTAFPQAKKIRLQISKLHPPIAGFAGSVSVEYRQRF